MRFKDESEHFANLRYLAQSNALHDNTSNDESGGPLFWRRVFVFVLIVGLGSYLYTNGF